MKAAFHIAVASIAVVSTGAMAQDAPNAKSLGMTLGATFLSLPDYQTGVQTTGAGSFSPTVGTSGVGANFGLSSGISIGKMGAFDAAIGLSGFATLGISNTSVTDTFSGPGVVIIGGYTTPGNANIDLVTNSGVGNSAASSAITHTNPQGGGEVINVNNPINAGGTINNYGATIAAGSNSFGYGAVVTQQGAANTSAAYGAVAASDGGVFIGAGDLTGLKVKTDVRRQLIYTGADLSLAVTGYNNDTAIQAYLGPSYRLMSQSMKATTSVDIPEAAPSVTTFPTYSMTRDEDLVSHYFGGIVGFNLARAVSDTVTLSLGAEGGVYYTQDSFKGREHYTIEGGSPSVTSTTVNNVNGIDMQDHGIAWSARIAPSVTVALASNRQLTFGGAVDYLSRVASVTRDGSVAVATNTYAGTDDGSLSYNAASQTVNKLAFAPMWSFTPTVSFTGQF